MNVEEIRAHCITKKLATESFPFGPETLVFKVMDKVFLLLSLDSHPPQFNAKNDPETSIQLREQYPDCIVPGYHMNKVHWNTIICDGTLSHNQLKELIDVSYNLIVKSLPKFKQKEFEE